MQLCAHCLERQRVEQKATRRARRIAGCCLDCGKDARGRSRCVLCRAKRNRLRRKMRRVEREARP